MNSGKANTETSNDKCHILLEAAHGGTIPGKKDNSQEEGDYANEEDDNAVESNAIAESVVEDSQVIDREERSKSHPCVIYWLATCATVSGLLFGYDTGIISGSLLLINEQYGLSSYYQVAIVSSTVVSAAVFSLVSGMVADAIGRKLTIMISAVVFTVGGVIMGFATGPEMILIGRIVVGASIGFVSSIVPVYVSECAPPDIRGRLLTLNQLFITIGIVVSSVMAGALQNIKPSGWRYMLGLAAIPGIVQFIFFFYLPESPRYQMMKNQEREAEITLKKIRNTNNVDQEMDEIRQSLKQEAESKGWHIWKQIFTTPHVRKALFIGCMLQVFQQFCGINTVIYYSGSILLSAGFSTEMAIWLACVPAVFNFLATFIGLWAVESLGRKLVLTLSFLAIAVALCVLCFGFAMSLAESPEANPANEPNSVADECSSMTTCNKCIEKTDVCGYCFLENTIKKPSMGACTRQVESKPQESRRYSRYGRCSKPDPSSSNKYLAENVQYNTAYCPSVYSYFAVGGLMLFVLGFAPGAGPMPWTINAEIYPMWCRGVANSLATTCNWVCNSIVTASFPFMIANFTAWGTFLLFAVICAIAAVFVLIFVPETKDKTLEEIEILFMTGETKERALAAREAHDIRRSVAKEVEIEPKMSVGPTGSSHIY